MKKIINIATMVSILFFFGTSLKAISQPESSGWEKPDFGESTLVTEFSKIKSLDDGIIKKETLSKYVHEYPKDLRGSYKYITVRTDFSYFEGKNKLADVMYESNFRINSECKRCECLSSTCCYECKDGSKIEAFTRRKNETLSSGSSTIKSKFKNGYTTYEDIEYNLKCDSDGDISMDE